MAEDSHDHRSTSADETPPSTCYRPAKEGLPSAVGIPDTMDPPTRSRSSTTAGRPASFARAAARLDEAAAKLSAAAEAMSAAAEIFASIAPAFKLAPVRTPIAVVVEQPTQTPALDQEIPAGYITEEECTNPEDSDYWLSDHEERAYADSKRGYTSQSSQHALDLIPPGPDTTMDPRRNINSPTSTLAPGSKPTGLYRILVDQEGDVLPTVCSVMQYYNRVVCYMACGLNILAIYKDLIESVTGTTTYTVTKSSAVHTNSVASRFFEHENAVLMLPETVSPDSQFGTSADLCVIHVDWPSDEIRYKKQIDTHRAQTNILVAFSEDSNLYTSGPNILLEAIPWPTHEKKTQPTNAFRRLFDQKLSDISAEKKESIYADWISCHGSCGSRYVESWDATNLVHRANLYILDVLRYNNVGSASVDLQVSLPRVSPGFVTHNKLESAVEDGVLHVRSEPGSKNTFSISKAEILARGATSLNETDGSRRSDSIPPPDFREDASANRSKRPAPGPEVPEHLPASSTGDGQASVDISLSNTFAPVSGHSYIAIDEEFDAIPLICFLAEVHGRLVCFLDEDALTHYRTLLGGIVRHQIYFPNVAKDSNVVENAAQGFMSHPSPAILLLSTNTKNLPASLKNIPNSCAVHWGQQHLPLRQAMKHYRQMHCPSTYVIMTTDQRNSRLESGTIEVGSHPNAEIFLSQGDSSVLATMRNKTRSMLASNENLTKSMYRARVYWLARTPRQIMSAEAVARNANAYAARVLLRGSAEDGNKTFKPTVGRPSVSAKNVSKYELQPAVDEGLLSLE